VTNVYSFFEKLVDPYPEAEPATPPKGLFAFCWHYTRPMWPWIAIMSVLTALISVVEVIIFSFIGDLVDWLTASSPATFLVDRGTSLALMAALIVLGLPLLAFAQSVFKHQTLYGNYPMRVRWQAHRYILGQSLSFFHNDFAGRISQKVMQTALSVRESVLVLMDVIVYVGVYFTGTLVLVSQADLLFAVPLIGWLAIYLGILFYFVPRMRDISSAQSEARALMTGRIVDSYTNIQTIKLFAHTQREREYARDAMDEFLKNVHRQMRLVTQLIVCLQMSNSLLLAATGGIAIYAWQQSSVTLGAIAVAISLVMRIQSMSHWILWEVAGLFENIGTVQDGITTIAKPLTVTDRPDAQPLVVAKGAIDFDHVRFHYGREGGVIEDFSLAIRPGEKVGLVGRSGAGKSTLVNLLLRFYDLEAGRILIDGQDIADVTQESLRRQIGLVTQDTSLLHRSVRDNIRYGRPEADEAAIVDAAHQARADEFIRGLADPKGRTGYDVHVGERGVKLSGGQRQRVAIARVLLKDAPILVLDEATSALDSEIEAAIQESLYALMEGKTVIAIAHRLSTIAAMDRLVVLDQGRIIEMGRHDELLAHGGLYADLWRRQSGGFLNFEDSGIAVFRPRADAAE
jgi:ATP-binding cassette subfamily B multidrug efflux pump